MHARMHAHTVDDCRRHLDERGMRSGGCSSTACTHTHAHTHTTILQSSWILSSTTRVSWQQKGKTNLALLVQEIVSGSGISWAICKSAPWPWHITTPTSHHSVIYRLDALPATELTASTQLKAILQSLFWLLKTLYEDHPKNKVQNGLISSVF